MAEPSLDHPDPVRLVAFGRGTLNHDEMAEVESHLSFCEPCCQLLSTLPDDRFVDLLRSSEKLADLAARGTAPLTDRARFQSRIQRRR